MRIQTLIFSLSLAIVSWGQQANLQERIDTMALRTSSVSDYEQPMTFHTPSTYAFARYGEYPVDYSTGKPNISIPLMSISARDLSVEVALSYYPGGIKVDQEATPVGLGWSLCAGGVITRQVRGIPDGFDSEKHFRQRSNIRMTMNTGESSEAFIKSELQEIKDAVIDRVNAKDPAPDIFYYNFCGHTGSFYLDGNAHGVVVRHGDMQVDMVCENNSGGTSFKIVDDDGTVYMFKATESCTSANFEKTVSAWYLTSIISPLGDTITFEYTSGGVLSDYVLEREYSTAYIALSADEKTHNLSNPYSTQTIKSSGSVTGVVLSKISSSDGSYIIFTYETGNRKDGQNGMGGILQKVTGYNSLGRIYKAYELSHDYFEADANHKQTKGTGYDFLNYRLKLTAVQEVSADGTSKIPPYTFCYQGDDGNENQRLPYRLSPCQDGWGYYNGSNNKNIFPNNSSTTPFITDSWYAILSPDNQEGFLKSYVVTGGGDRRTNRVSIKACTLNAITYPTGGTTTFDFGYHEINQQYGEVGYGGLRIEKISTDDGSGHVKERTFTYGTPNIPTSIELGEKVYHTYFHQGLDENRLGKIRDVLLAMGIPYAYIDKPDILRITTTSPLILGLEQEFLYPLVEETEGDGRRTVYEYTCTGNGYYPGNSTSAPYYKRALYIYDSTTALYPKTVLTNEASPYIFPYMHYPNNDWMRGDLTRKAVYDASGSLLAEDTYTYYQKTLSAEAGYKSIAFSDNEFLVACDYMFNGITRLWKENHVESGCTTTTTYTYSDIYQTNPSVKTTIESTGKTVEEKFYYPKDYDNTFSVLVSKNITTPIDIRKEIDGQLVEGIQVGMNHYGQITGLYKYDQDGTSLSFNKDQPYTFTQYVQREYDATSHNLFAEHFKKGDRHLYYVWSYGNSYPIASVETATRLLDESVLTQQRNSLATKKEPSSADYTLLKRQLETLPNSVFTLYKYLPSVGMTEAVDSRGTGYTYVYDGLGRLSARKQIAGNKEHALENYIYNYKH